MKKLLLTFSLAATFVFIANAQCYQLNTGQGLKLFSPFLGNTPRTKTEVKGRSFGDISNYRFCKGTGKKWVIGSYKCKKDEPIFATHSGVVTVYTSVSNSENNQLNDAVWIDGDSITTNYIGIFPSVMTGQYVYAGQQIGKTYIEVLSEVFGFGIRRAFVLNPINKRGFLPYIHDSTSQCECEAEPLWPEYFVNPASKYIDYGNFNEEMPNVSLKVNIEPSGVGQWSFDNGVTWLSGSNKISALPFGHYKIIFKNEYGYTSPNSYQINVYPTNKDVELNVKYLADYSIIKRPDAQIQQQQIATSISRVKDSFAQQLKSQQNIIIQSIGRGEADSFRRKTIDSVNNKLLKIESTQKEQLFFTKLFKYIIPLLLLAIAFTIILLFQNLKIRKQKKYLENIQKEQHHRVHNSLSLVSSLLNKYGDNITPDKLRYIDNSIIAIAAVHRQLYKGNDLDNINFQPVAENIINSLISQAEDKKVIVVSVSASIIISQKKSTPLALMLNELVTNSIKYGFNNNRVNNKISLTAIQTDKFITLVYTDTGKGYNEDFLAGKTTGFGKTMLEGLAHQLRAKIRFYNDGGACCIIKL